MWFSCYLNQICPDELSSGAKNFFCQEDRFIIFQSPRNWGAGIRAQSRIQTINIKTEVNLLRKIRKNLLCALCPGFSMKNIPSDVAHHMASNPFWLGSDKIVFFGTKIPDSDLHQLFYLRNLCDHLMHDRCM